MNSDRKLRRRQAKAHAKSRAAQQTTKRAPTYSEYCLTPAHLKAIGLVVSEWTVLEAWLEREQPLSAEASALVAKVRGVRDGLLRVRWAHPGADRGMPLGERLPQDLAIGVWPGPAGSDGQSVPVAFKAEDIRDIATSIAKCRKAIASPRLAAQGYATEPPTKET